jgi:DNA invertase Pin-like site-specific DNA recombinase
MKAALYPRISTRDQHSIPMQLDAMRRYAQLRGWQIVAEIK